MFFQIFTEDHLVGADNDPNVVVKFYLDAVVKLEGMSHAW